MAYKNDVGSLRSMVNEMESYLTVLEDTVNALIKDVYGQDLSIKDKISKLPEDALNTYTEEEIDSIFGEDGITVLLEKKADDEEYKDKTDLEFKKHVLSDLIESVNGFTKLREEKDQKNQELTEITNHWFEYVNSVEYKDKLINELTERLESATSPREKSIIQKKLDAYKDDKLSFLFERIEAIGEKEVQNIVDIYFHKTRSVLVMDKFKAKITRYGYTEAIYKMFFNLEEKFLPEDYHVFNNLFLFNVMRYISFVDTNNEVESIYVGRVLSNLYNLIYHKFNNEDLEKDFINLIIKFDTYFLDYMDTFEEKNITYPNHPHRIKKDQEFEEKRRLMVIAALQNEGIEPDTTLDTAELRKMLQDVMDKKSSGKPVIENTEEENVETEAEPSDVLDNTSEVEELNEINETEDSDDIQEVPVNTDDDTDANNIYCKLVSTDDAKEVGDLLLKINGWHFNPNTYTTGSLMTPYLLNDKNLAVMSTEEFNEYLSNYIKNKPEEISKDVIAWEDKHKCYYIEKGQTFTYYNTDGTVLENGVPPETICMLINTDSITKVTLPYFPVI